MEKKQGIIVRLSLSKNKNGFYLVGQMFAFWGGERTELPTREKILKLTSKTDEETKKKIKAVLEEKKDEITDLYADNRLYEAEKYFTL